MYERKRVAKKPKPGYITRSGRKPIGVTVNDAENELIQRAAAAAGLPKTQFVLRAALAKAKRVLDRQTGTTRGKE